MFNEEFMDAIIDIIRIIILIWGLEILTTNKIKNLEGEDVTDFWNKKEIR